MTRVIPCPGVVAAAVVWVFAVDVSEMWHVPSGPTPGVMRSMGGWTHNGPYKTRMECEKARQEMLAKPYTYHDESHTRWDKPRECRSKPLFTVEAYGVEEAIAKYREADARLKEPA